MTGYADELRVGIVQTTLENTSAWAGGIRMSHHEEERAVAEIQQHAAALGLENPRPQIILLPELSVPTGFLPRLKRISAQTNSIIIGGMDFHRIPGTRRVMNRAAVIVPSAWGSTGISRRTTVRYVGKTYPAWREADHLGRLGYDFQPVPEVWVFDAGNFGRFAVAICYDFLDLERVAMYRLRVQSLFILGYNPDITSFDHAAEAMARMVFCNIVICNTGFCGGSLAVSPYHKLERRILYRHSGARLSTSQTISLPIASLIQAQAGVNRGDFKSLPPGANPHPELVQVEGALG